MTISSNAFLNRSINQSPFKIFLIKLDIKPLMHLVENSIFSLNNVIVRPTKIMNRVDKNWAHFQKLQYIKNQNFQKTFSIKVGLLVQYFSKNFSLERFDQFSTLKNDFKKPQNFEMFQEVVHNFGKSDGYIIQ